MSADLERSWERVRRWLSDNAPVSYSALKPPATLDELQECESRLTARMPAQLRTLLLMNSGAAGGSPDRDLQFGARFLPGGHSLLPATQIAPRQQMLNQISEGLPEEMLGFWWHTEWVPFAEHVAADALVIDQRPGVGAGRVGEFMHEGQTAFDWAASLEQFVSDLADSLEQGLDHRYFRPRVVEGRLAWEVIGNSPAPRAPKSD